MPGVAGRIRVPVQHRSRDRRFVDSGHNRGIAQFQKIKEISIITMIENKAGWIMPPLQTDIEEKAATGKAGSFC
jgi:hypothetical protein